MVDLKKFGFEKEERLSDALDGTVFPTGYPTTVVTKRLVYEDTNPSMEDTYYWFLNFMRTGLIMPRIEKIIDSYAASEHSSLWGAAQQRVSLQQQNASQYMRGVSEMLKGLFQLVRELRDLDMRLTYYDKSSPEFWHSDPRTAENSEITLKGLWVDLVEGGSKSPASVYGMAQQIGFTILPDLFFRTQVHTDDIISEIGPRVDKITTNPKVKEVLERKLRQYYEWKRHSEKELRHRKQWTLKYLRQHYNTIKLYVQWIKPYLRNARALALSEKHGRSPDLIKTFESNLSEIEVLSAKKVGEFNAVVLLNFLYRTRPMMEYNRDNFQHRGPAHAGQITMSFRAYCWTDDEIENYKKMREEEDFELVGDYDRSIMESLDALGDDLKDYLKEAGEKFPEPEAAHLPSPKVPLWDKIPILEPFVSVAKGMGELFGSLIVRKEGESHDDHGSHDDHSGHKNAPKHAGHSSDDHDEHSHDDHGPTSGAEYEWRKGKSKKAAQDLSKKMVADLYKTYKKSHGMLTW